MKYLITAIILALGAMLMWFAATAEAHGHYTGRTDPVTGNGCCGGNDCAPVPLAANWVRPVADGFQVTLTVEQARAVNPNAELPINVIVPWSRVMTLTGGPPAIYHLCIWDSQLKCLFVASST